MPLIDCQICQNSTPQAKKHRLQEALRSEGFQLCRQQGGPCGQGGTQASKKFTPQKNEDYNGKTASEKSEIHLQTPVRLFYCHLSFSVVSPQMNSYYTFYIILW